MAARTWINIATMSSILINTSIRFDLYLSLLIGKITFNRMNLIVTERRKMYENQDYPARQFVIICAYEIKSTRVSTSGEKI